MTAAGGTIEHREATAFLNDLFGRKSRDDLLIQIWKKSDKSSRYLSSPDAAAKYAVEEVKSDAYVGVSLVAKNLGRRRRGAAVDSVGIPGFWADIDVNGGPEDKKNAAPTIEAAEAIARSVLEPTLLVHSGYGLQAWYLFEEPMIFHTPTERTRAEGFARGWIHRLRKEANAAGFTIDSTQDLARLMRVPGTTNGKGGLAAPVTGYKQPCFEQDGPRYELSAIAEYVEAIDAPAKNNGNVNVALTGEAPPFAKLEAMRENNAKFEDTWQRKRVDHPEWSPSEFCLSIASFCVHADWTDQEIANTLQAYRSKHSDEEKHEGFYTLTINKARSISRDTKREEQREEAVQELVQIGDSEDPNDADPDRIATIFSQIIGGGFKVKELIKSNNDPDTAIYRLVMDDGSTVKIGSFDNLDDPNRFAKQFGVAKDYRPPLVKKSDWIKALNGLLKMVVVRDAEVTTMHSQVLGWLRQYIDATITPDHNEAAVRRDPFVRGEHIWIAPKSFYGYISRQLRVNIKFSELEELLDTLGFEKRAKNFRDSDTPSGQNTTRDYYRAPLVLLEEAHEDHDDDEESTESSDDA